jgi:hypothetical protein
MVVRGVLFAVLGVLVLFPCVLAAWLWHQRVTHGSLDHLKSRSVSVLFSDFRPTLFWWELVVYLRRVVMLAVLVPVVSSSQSAGKLGFAFSVLFFLAVQWVFQPFAHNIQNVLESVSLLGVLAMTMVFSFDIPSEAQVVLGSVAMAVLAVALIAPSLIRLASKVILVLRGLRRPVTEEEAQMSAPRPTASDPYELKELTGTGGDLSQSLLHSR